MIESIYDEIISEHKDFNNDDEKTSENNLMRFNNPNLNTTINLYCFK